ncbi:MAG: stage II sporulation protein M [Thermoprotei archaeon]
MLELSEQNTVVCPKCGAINPLNANYCYNCGLQLQPKAQPYPEPTQTQTSGGAFSKKNILEAFTTKRVKLMVVVFIVELALLLAFSALPMSQAQYQAIVNSSSYSQLSRVRSEPLILRSASIFENNYLLASLEILPVIGPAIFVYTTYSTARVLVALGYTQSVPGPLLFLNIMFFPHSWIELPAYAISATQSILLVYSGIKKRFYQELARTIVVWLFVGLELFVAAIIESSIIALEQQGALSLILWLPTLAIFYLSYRVIKRLNSSQSFSGNPPTNTST